MKRVSICFQVFWLTLNYSIVLFMLAAVMGAVFSVIVLRLILLTFMHRFLLEAKLTIPDFATTSPRRRNTTNIPFLKQFSIPMASSIAAFINACIIELSGVLFQVRELAGPDFSTTYCSTG